MARPLSEEKRQAILDAAAELVASLGTSAPTARIAQAAGVSEGTLFTYFATKDDLLNQLFVEIETDLARILTASYPTEGGPRDRLQTVWDRLIDWGIARPVWRKAMRQLKVSERVTDDSRRRCEVVFREARDRVVQSLAGHSAPERTSFYVDTFLMGLADIAIEAILANPKDDRRFRQAGFELFWKGTAA